MKQYSMDISTNFTDEDRTYLKPIYTIKYYSKLNPSVIQEAIFSKNIEDGVLTLHEASLCLKEILEESIKENLLIETSVSKEFVLTNEEIIEIDKLEDIIRYT